MSVKIHNKHTLTFTVIILAWFVWAVFDTLKDLPTVYKGCELMLCVS